MRGKWALITGATAGFGLATAELLGLEKGMNLIITGRRQERLDALAAKLRAKVEVKTLAFDVSDRAATEKAIATCEKELKVLSVLVNNAGLAVGTQSLAEGKLDDWDTMIDTNIKGLLYVTRLVLPYMLAHNGGHGEGHIVNVGSVAGRFTYPGGGVYAATKFAVRALSDGLRMDLMGKKIRVTNIEPGMAETEFSEVRLQDKEKASAVYKGMTPLSARDIAESIAWCLERPAHVNISELMIYPVDQVGVGPSYTHREK
jgi:3-hydroxy acid dehydrogenase/malonic semialdehyde reductase